MPLKLKSYGCHETWFKCNKALEKNFASKIEMCLDPALSGNKKVKN